MTDLWVARDFIGLWIGRGEPQKSDQNVWVFKCGDCRWIPDDWIDIEMGECRRLVMAEEKSE